MKTNMDCVKLLGLGDNIQGMNIMKMSHFMSIAHPTLQKFQTDHTISLCSRAAEFTVGSARNACLIALLGHRLQHDWKGSLIITSRSGSGLNDSNTKCLDATPGDIRVALNFFTSIGYSMNVVKGIKRNPDVNTPNTSPAGMVTAVNINCFGDQRDNGNDKYAEVKIPRDHPVFEQLEPTTSFMNMQLPFLVQKKWEFRGNNQWHCENDDVFGTCLSNEAAVCLDPNVGIADPALQIFFNQTNDPGIGNVLVARKDGKDLKREHVEAVVAYRAAGIVLRFASSEPHIVAIEAAARLTREKFERFFEEFKLWKIDCGEKSWKDIVSPYKV